MKRLVALLLGMLTCLSLFACQNIIGSNSSDSTGAGVGNNSSTESDDVVFTQEELLEGLIDLREAKLVPDAAKILYQKGEDVDKDGRLWKINVETLTDGTKSLFTLAGNFDFDWVPEGLFGAVPGISGKESTSVVKEYLDKTIGFWVRSPADCTIMLEGLSAGWKRIYDTAGRVELIAGKWTYVEFYLGAIEEKYYYYGNISCSKKTVLDIDCFQILDEPTLQSELSIKNGKTSPDRARNAYLAGQDADSDGWLWGVDTENLNSDFKNVVVALSGASAYNVTSGTDGNWCPSGILGVETYGISTDKCLGMYVKASKTTTFTLQCMNSELQVMEMVESAQVAQGGTWTWIEFDLKNVPESYRYVSCIVADIGGTIQVDGLTLFNR